MPLTHKKPVTYGRRGKTSELTPAFEALSQRTPKKISPASNLPSPSASPLRSPFTAPALRKDKNAASEADVFDVPLSEEESQLKPRSTKRLTRPTSNASTPDRAKARKPNVRNPAISQRKLVHPKVDPISAHSELFGLSLPDANGPDPLSSVRPAKRQRTSNSSDTSSRASIFVQSITSPPAIDPNDPNLTVPEDTWEVPSTDSDSHAPNTHSNRKNQAKKILDFRPRAKPVTRKPLRSPIPVSASVTGTNSKVPIPSTPDGTPAAASSSSSVDDSYNESPTPRNKTAVASASPSPQKGASTPKQAKLWGKLLVDEHKVVTPSKHFQLLSLDTAHNDRSRAASRKKGLVDALMTSAPATSLDDDDDDDDDDDQLSQVSATLENEGEEDFHESGKMLSIATNGLASNRSLNGLDFNETEDQPDYEKRTLSSNKVQKRTYGGHRSYLEESSDGLQSLLDQPIEMDESPVARGLDPGLASSLLVATRSKEATTLEDGLDDEDRGVRTVYDLKAAGDMEHFTDEVNEIIDDLSADKTSRSRKRMALLDLHKKLLDPAFRVRFNQHGYGTVIFRLCLTDADSIMGAVGAAVLVQVLGLTEKSDDASQLYEAGCLRFLDLQLTESRDLTSLAKDRRNNLSRGAQESIASFVTSLQQTFPWKEKCLSKVSPQVLALVALETLIRKLREQGNMDSLLYEPMLSRLLDILDSSSAKLHHQSQDDEPSQQLCELETILSLLESCTTTAAGTMDKSTWTDSRLKRLSQHLESAMLIDNPSVKRLTPRLVLNLANGNEAYARVFARGSFVKHMISRILTEFEALGKAKNESLDLDVLLLCLGAMLNLAEHCRDIRSAVTADGTEQLNALITDFLRGRKLAEEADSLAAVQVNVAHGWLAVLLGSLCQSEKVRTHVIKHIPGKGLKTLIEAVDEFISHHKAADQTADGNEAYAVFTKRLEGIADQLKTLDE